MLALLLSLTLGNSCPVGANHEYVAFLKAKIIAPTRDSSKLREHAVLVLRYSMERDLDPDLVMSVITVESAWDPRARSSADAVGLMQVMPFWTDRLDYGKNLRDPETNIRYGTYILRFYLDMYNNNYVDALSAYNRGPYLVNKDKKQGKRGSMFSERVLRVFNKLKRLNSFAGTSVAVSGLDA